jgi:hypothetical protein
MGRFTIYLPNNITGEVRCGKAAKLNRMFISSFLPWKKGRSVGKTIYTILIQSNTIYQLEYRLFKTREGYWSEDVEGKEELEAPLVLAIIKAIEEHETACKQEAV